MFDKNSFVHFDNFILNLSLIIWKTEPVQVYKYRVDHIATFLKLTYLSRVLRTIVYHENEIKKKNAYESNFWFLKI